jgi:hypothetical protein
LNGKKKQDNDKNVWAAGLAAPVMIAMLLLLAGSLSLAAHDQPSAAKAEVVPSGE